MADLTDHEEAKIRGILEAVIDSKTPAIMTYLSRGKWHVAKLMFEKLGATRLVASVVPTEKPHPLNVQLEQPVGISVKYGYGKIVFETQVSDLEAPNSQQPNSGGKIVLHVPIKIQVIERRNYFRVHVPSDLKVNVTMWHRGQHVGENGPSHFWQGSLRDISAGGAMLAIDAAEKPDFMKGQFVSIRFTPLPYEQPLMFNGQIRSVLPTADESSICYGLQIVGLEASQEGHETLKRLCAVVEEYYRLNKEAQKTQAAAHSQA